MALQVYTSQYRYFGEDRLDITVKTSDGTFAPTWEMVKKYKSGEMSDEEYTRRYLLLMQKSFIENRDKWEELLSRERLTLVCFCPKGRFCHRRILANILVKIFGAEYKGEIEP